MCHLAYTGGQTGSKVDASSKKAISALALANARTKENDTETNLGQVGLNGERVKNLRSLVCKFWLDHIKRKLSQRIASTRKSWPN